jgi:hypothetical protein
MLKPILATIGLALITTSAYAADRLPPDREPSSMTPTEIKAFNAGLEVAHPYYIRCRKTEVIGSLVKKLRVCRTNQQWTTASAAGNTNARETVEAMSRAPINSSN